MRRSRKQKAMDQFAQAVTLIVMFLALAVVAALSFMGMR